jgi:hypothetical protein
LTGRFHAVLTAVSGKIHALPMQAIWRIARGWGVFRYRYFGLYYAFQRGRLSCRPCDCRLPILSVGLAAVQAPRLLLRQWGAIVAIVRCRGRGRNVRHVVRRQPAHVARFCLRRYQRSAGSRAPLRLANMRLTSAVVLNLGGRVLSVGLTVVILLAFKPFWPENAHCRC